MHVPTLGLLLGDPCGIGPELSVKLLSDDSILKNNRIVLIGDPEVFQKGCDSAEINFKIQTTDTVSDIPKEGIGLLKIPFIDMDSLVLGQTSSTSGKYVLDSLRVALNLFKKSELDGFSFAPLNKESLILGGSIYDDDLRFIADELDFDGFCCELNTTNGLWTSRVTSHIPLKDVASAITQKGIINAVIIVYRTLIEAGVEKPKISIAALNPHASDGGNFGKEEAEVILPAVKEVKKIGIPVKGPLPADTVFVRAQRGEFDAVVTMYHDQGQIAMKLMGFDHGVTVLGGLPIPVTTPAHGTAFDIAGQGIANSAALKAAWKLLNNMTRSRLECGFSIQQNDF